MKTKTRTLIAVCILAFAGLLNANAATNLVEKNLASGNGATNFSALNGFEINEAIDYQKEAQLVTRWIADMAEAKATQQIIERNDASANQSEVFNTNNDEIIDFRKEAQLVTRTVADREEANAIQKLVTEGKLVEN